MPVLDYDGLVHYSGIVKQDIYDSCAQTIVDVQNSVLNVVRANPLDLTVAFAGEIANYSNAWDWIQNRITNVNWNGLMVGDYIPMTMTHSGTAYTFAMQIAGIDTYYNCTDVAVPHHIDFISKEISYWTVQWNTSNNNNGTEDESYPYLASNIYDHLINTVLPELPEEVRNVIMNKRFVLESRYSSSGTLTEGTTWAWKDLGNLWIPSSVEVSGDQRWVDARWSSYGAHYPIFATTNASWVKVEVGTSTRATWWTLCPTYGYSGNAVIVNTNGRISGNNGTSNSYRFPICFRVGSL